MLPLTASMASSSATLRRRGKKLSAKGRLPPLFAPAAAAQGSETQPLRRSPSALSRFSARSSTAAGGGGGGGGEADGSGGPPTGTRSSAWARVQRQRSHGRDILRTSGDAATALTELLKALALQAAAPGGLLDPVGVTAKGVVAAGASLVEPAWLCAEEVVHLANDRGASGAVTAAPPEDINPFFREALRLVCLADDDVEEMLEGDCLGILRDDGSLAAAPASAASPGRPTGTVRVMSVSGSAALRRPESSSGRGRGGASASVRGSGASWKVGPDYFQCFPALRSSLGAVVLNNVAVRMQAVGQPPSGVLRVLQRALQRCAGVLGTGIMYNIAVTHAAMGQPGKARDAASRCAELCAAYLQVDPRGPAETALEAAELADTYSTFIAFVAGHMVACQLLLAALSTHAAAASSGAAGALSLAAEAEAVRHCRHAVCCAAAFLPPAHPAHRRAAARLAAAQERLDSAHGEGAANIGSFLAQSPPPPPLQLPLVVLHVAIAYSPSPMMSEAPAVEDARLGDLDGWCDAASTGGTAAATAASAVRTAGSGGSAAVATEPQSPSRPSFEMVMLSRMLLLWGSVKVPATVRGYLKRSAKLLMQHSMKRRVTVDTARSNRQAHMTAVSADAGGSIAKLRNTTLSASSGWSRGPRRQSSPHADSPPPCPADGEGTWMGDARATGSAPAPLIITEMPRAAFHRYTVLKHNALRFVDDMTTAAAAAGNEMSISGGASATRGFSPRRAWAPTPPALPMATTGSYDWESAQQRRHRMSTLYYSVHAGAEEAEGRRRGSGDGREAGTAEPGCSAAATAGGIDGAEDPRVPVPTLSVMQPSEQMRVMDAELLRYSQLVVDMLPEIRDAAACAIQRRWRGYTARRCRLRRSAEVAAWQRGCEAAAIILRAYRCFKACQPHREERCRRQAAHTRELQVTLIQRYLFQKQGVEEWGRRCLAAHERLLAVKRQRELESASAMVVQSWWRMAQARAAYGWQRHAALTLQCAWRSCKARRELTRRRVLQRLAYEDFLRRHRGRIICMQRWYRACKARIAVNGLLQSKQDAVAAHLDGQETDFHTLMGPWADDLDRATHAVRVILSVLHGAQARAEVRQRHVAMECVRRAVTRWVLRTQGRTTRESLRQRKQDAERIQRRREEVLDATLHLQAATRRWLVRRERGRAATAAGLLHSRATLIQATYRAYRQRSRDREARNNPELREEEEAEGLRRRQKHSATKIQATYRMHRTRAANAAYLQFMLVDRHTIACRIQHAWRIHVTRRAADQRRRLMEEVAHHWQREEQSRVAAVRAQAVVRMYLARCRVLRLLDTKARENARDAALEPARVGWRTPYQRFAAARRIQAVWRGYAARCYAHQVRLATAHYTMQKTTLESLHAYATIIQRVVRGRLLRGPRRSPSPPDSDDGTVTGGHVAAPRGRGPRSSDDPCPVEVVSLTEQPLLPTRPAASAGAARGRGRAKLWAARPTSAPSIAMAAASTSAREEVADAEALGEGPPAESPGWDAAADGVQEAAVVEHEVATPSVTRSSLATAVMPRRTPSEPPSLVHSAHVADAFRGGAAADRERLLCSTEALERQAAAVRIQHVWRGYHSRFRRARAGDERAEEGGGSDAVRTQLAPRAVAEEAEHSDEGSTEEYEESEESEEDDRTGQSTFATLASSVGVAVRGSLSLSSGQAIAQGTDSNPFTPHTASTVPAPAAMTTAIRTVSTEEANTETVTITTTITVTAAADRMPPPPRHRSVDVTRQLPCTASYTAEQHAAAVLIQKVWRGYSVRCMYEFYYEEYEEEVTVSDEDDIA